MIRLTLFTATPNAAALVSLQSSTRATWCFGMTRVWKSARGWMSRNAKQNSSSYTLWAGASPAMIWQKMQLGSVMLCGRGGRGWVGGKRAKKKARERDSYRLLWRLLLPLLLLRLLLLLLLQLWRVAMWVRRKKTRGGRRSSPNFNKPAAPVVPRLTSCQGFFQRTTTSKREMDAPALPLSVFWAKDPPLSRLMVPTPSPNTTQSQPPPYPQQAAACILFGKVPCQIIWKESCEQANIKHQRVLVTLVVACLACLWLLKSVHRNYDT